MLIVGFGALGHDLWRRVRRHSEAGYEVAGIYAEPHENLPSQVRRLHSLDQLHAFVLEHGVREIWIVLPMEAGQELREVLYHLRNDLVDVRWIPDVLSIQLLGHRIGDFLGLPAIQLNTLPAAGVRPGRSVRPGVRAMRADRPVAGHADRGRAGETVLARSVLFTSPAWAWTARCSASTSSAP